MDAQEFLSYLLDICHEELKHLYVSQKATSKTQCLDDWATFGSKERSVQDNSAHIMQNSIVRDIFGGTLKTEVTVESTNQIDVIQEPFYVLNLEIPSGCFDL